MQEMVYLAYSVEANGRTHYVLSLEDSWKGKDPKRMANLIIGSVFPKVKQVVFYAARRTQRYSKSVAGILMNRVCQSDMRLSSIEPYEYSDKTLRFVIQYGYRTFGEFSYGFYREMPDIAHKVVLIVDLFVYALSYTLMVILLTPVNYAIGHGEKITTDGWKNSLKKTFDVPRYWWASLLLDMIIIFTIFYVREYKLNQSSMHRRNKKFHKFVGESLEELSTNESVFNVEPKYVPPEMFKSFSNRDVKAMFLEQRNEAIAFAILKEEVPSLFIIDPIHNVEIESTSVREKLTDYRAVIHSNISLPVKIEVVVDDNSVYEEDVPLIDL